MINRILIFLLLLCSLSASAQLTPIQDTVPPNGSLPFIPTYRYKIINGKRVPYLYYPVLNKYDAITTAASIRASLSGYVPFSGGTLTGRLSGADFRAVAANDNQGYSIYDASVNGNHIGGLYRNGINVALKGFDGIDFFTSAAGGPATGVKVANFGANNISFYKDVVLQPRAYSDNGLSAASTSFVQLQNAATWRNKVQHAAIELHPFYGQSNSGVVQASIWTTNGNGLPNSTPQPYNTFMPKDGAFGVNVGEPLWPLKLLNETVGEGPGSGETQMYIRRYEVESGLDWNAGSPIIVSSYNGIGGQPIENLSLGTANFTRFIDYFQRMRHYADSLGVTIRAPYVLWHQGETNQDQRTSDYSNKLGDHINQTTNNINSATAQRQRVPFISSQLAYRVGEAYADWDIVAGVQYNFNKNNDLFMISAPSYQYKYSKETDTVNLKGNQRYVHVIPADKRHMGGYDGIAGERYVLNKSKFKPLDVTDVKVTGNVITLKYYVPVPPLVLSSDLPSVTNYGYRLTNTAGTPVSITSVSLVDGNTVQIVASQAALGLILYYAVTPDQTTYDNGDNTYYLQSRGNVHDSQNITDVFDGYRYYNWSLSFKIPLGADLQTISNPIYQPNAGQGLKTTDNVSHNSVTTNVGYNIASGYPGTYQSSGSPIIGADNTNTILFVRDASGGLIVLNKALSAELFRVNNDGSIKAGGNNFTISSTGAVKASTVTIGANSSLTRQTLLMNDGSTGAIVPASNVFYNGTNVLTYVTPPTLNNNDLVYKGYTDATYSQIPNNFRNNAATLTLPLTNLTNYGTFYGTTATWTLGTIAAGSNVTYYIKNAGSGILTINSATGGNDIYYTSAVATISIAAGNAIIIHNDGVNWQVE